ncbi:hypothetical protein [uncultured Mediterranean phage uvMED]|nr:hypothetical protein [uncultured Mediterranean phage uvMED]|tara:strand:- start:351 stop:470 length:120 start_codon:yes stop_codon:yes gene_type:complete
MIIVAERLNPETGEWEEYEVDDSLLTLLAEQEEVENEMD